MLGAATGFLVPVAYSVLSSPIGIFLGGPIACVALGTFGLCIESYKQSCFLAGQEKKESKSILGPVGAVFASFGVGALFLFLLSAKK